MKVKSERESFSLDLKQGTQGDGEVDEIGEAGELERKVQEDQFGLDVATTILVEKQGKKQDVTKYLKYNQQGTEFTSLCFINKTSTEKLSQRLPAEGPKDYEVYNFTDSGDGKSWLLGDDSTNKANAFIGGYKKCPKDIIVPRNLTNEEGETRPVEVIGRYAYNSCGYPTWGKETKTVLVTKQVRIIKERGFGGMHDIESFRIEEGSVLQSIEKWGLDYIGQFTGRDDEKKRKTLTLPSTLSSVASEGIRHCNLFKIIIYCGTHSLSNICDLEWVSFGTIEETKVRVTNQYSANTIFGYDALKDSPTDVEGNCSRMALKPTPSSSRSVSPSPFPTPTPSNNCPHSLLKHSTLCLAALFFALLPSHSISSSSLSISASSPSFVGLLRFVHSFSVSFQFAC